LAPSQENDKRPIGLLSVSRLPLLLKQLYKDPVPPTVEAIISFVFQKSEEVFCDFPGLYEHLRPKQLTQAVTLTRGTLFEIRILCVALASAMLPDGKVPAECRERTIAILRELAVMEYLNSNRYTEEFDRLYAVTAERGLKYGKHLQDTTKLINLLYQNLLWAATDLIKESSERAVMIGSSMDWYFAESVLRQLLVRYVEQFASFTNRTFP
jgi:hypothetical protein